MAYFRFSTSEPGLTSPFATISPSGLTTWWNGTAFESYDATTANMSRFFYAGTNGDIVTSGAMPDLVSYLVSKNGVAT